jgi:hypothetical protein
MVWRSIDPVIVHFERRTGTSAQDPEHGGLINDSDRAAKFGRSQCGCGRQQAVRRCEFGEVNNTSSKQIGPELSSVKLPLSLTTSFYAKGRDE